MGTMVAMVRVRGRASHVGDATGILPKRLSLADTWHIQTDGITVIIISNRVKPSQSSIGIGFGAEVRLPLVNFYFSFSRRSSLKPRFPSLVGPPCD